MTVNHTGVDHPHILATDSSTLTLSNDKHVYMLSLPTGFALPKHAWLEASKMPCTGRCSLREILRLSRRMADNVSRGSYSGSLSAIAQHGWMVS